MTVRSKGNDGKESVKKLDLDGVYYDNEQGWHLFRRLPLADNYKGKTPICATFGGGPMNLDVEVTGKIPDVEVHVTTNPSLPREDAVLLLTTGSTRERLARSGTTTAGLYVGRAVLDAIMGPSDPDKESFLDRFEFESGRDVTAEGDPTMEARFRLAKRIPAAAGLGGQPHPARRRGISGSRRANPGAHHDGGIPAGERQRGVGGPARGPH